MSLIKKTSSIDGLGIFTSKFINSGEVFYRIPTDSISSTPKTRFARIGENCYVNDPEILNYINHSCDPNIEIDLSGPEPSLVAIVDIKPGSEITCDYNVTEIDGKRVKCNCGSNDCRGYFLREE